jgi:DNA-binding GntR family transcriptional regulator
VSISNQKLKIENGELGCQTVPVAQPELKRAKISRAVVEYVQREIFEGRLRPGDRVDVELISATLGVSPTPVREALLLLERDGVITSRVHRAAFVEHFDARTLRADFHVLGLLSGVAVARLAKDRDPSVIAELQQMLQELEATPPEADGRRRELATEILRLEHRAGATPRLRAELRGFGGFLSWAAQNTAGLSHDETVQGHARVLDAIVAGDERGASQRRLAHARATAEEVIQALIQRGVLPDDGTATTSD